MRKILIFAVVLSVVLMLSVFSNPAFAVKGPVMDYLQMRFYSSAASLWSALKEGKVDLYGLTLSYDQYIEASGDPNIIVAPYTSMNSYDLSINNNKTITAYPNWRSPTNYTEFRQAVACCVDKDGLISGPYLKGMAARIDTYMPLQLVSLINFDVWKYGPHGELLNNYPWDYNPLQALQILYDNNWYDKSIYPTFSAVLAEYNTPDGLKDKIGTTSGAVYPPGHSKVGQPLDSLIAYARIELPARTHLMDQVADDLRKLGVGVDITYGTSSVCWDPVYVYRNYHLYTGGIGAGTIPTWLYYFNSAMDYPGSYSNFCVHDEDVDPWTVKFYENATSVEDAIEAAKMIQYYQVMRVYSVPVWVPSTYFAYRKGLVNVCTEQGMGLFYTTDHTFLTTYHENYPTVNTMSFGTGDLPTKLNPLFITYQYDAQVIQRIFTFPMITNPYNLGIGKSPLGGDTPWMVYDWKYELDPTTGNAIITLWFRHNIKWHDGVPFTVDDLNESIALYQYYDDSAVHADAMRIVNFEKIDDWTCKLYFDMKSVWTLYIASGLTIVPKHIYGFTSGKHHPLPTDPDYLTGGPHGEWPWKGDTVTPVTDPAQVWVGCNMWKYVPGSYVGGEGGGMKCEAFQDFFVSVLPGDIDWVYTWNPGAPPQSGSFKVGLTDLVYLANAYGTRGDGAVSFRIPGSKGAWNPGADLASPSGRVGLSDLVTLAKNYGKTWGSP
jgi:ABC-type transport system substrate-binding protein